MRQVDTVADPGSRLVEEYLFTGADAASIDSLILLLESMCLNQGWTTDASTTTSGHPDRTMKSDQSPWHDDTTGAAPAEYVARVRLRFYATSNNTLKIRASTASGAASQSADSTLPASATNPYRINVNGFQVTMRQKTGNSAFYIGCAPHTPHWFQKMGLKECLYSCSNGGSGGLKRGLYDQGVAFLHMDSDLGSRTLDATLTVANTPRVMAMRGYGNGTPRFANPIDDLTLVDLTKWFPFLWPAAIGVPNGAGTIFIETNGITYFFWFWDMIVLPIDPAGVAPISMTLDNGNVYEAVTFDNGSSGTAVGMMLQRSL